MKIGRRLYDLMYRYWAPWDAVGVRPELLTVLARGEVTPETHPRAIDLGCGTGANVVHLASLGFDVVGVEFSPVALAAARARAEQSGVGDRCRFVEHDLTDPTLLTADAGTFDLLLDASTLDDLDTPGRRAMAENIARLAQPGATLLCWCFYARPEELPVISFTGPSRLSAGLSPGEEQTLFGRDFAVVTRTETERFHAFLELRRLPTSTPAGEPSPGEHEERSRP